jgi:urease accessory protein
MAANAGIEGSAGGAAGWHARLELGFECGGGGRTVLAHRKHHGPLRVQKALYPEGEHICHTVIVHPPGGIAAGDRLEIDLRLGAASHALITTPGATKWYKTPGASAAQAVHVAAQQDAVLEWLPQEAIVFNQANAAASLDVTLSDSALFLGWDTLCFGRTAAGERFAEGSYRQRWQIRQGSHLLWNEAGLLRGGSALLSSAVGLGGQPVCATLVAAGRAVDGALLDAVRAAIALLPSAPRLAATRLPKVLAIRYLGPSTEEARDAFIPLWGILRPHLTGIIAQVPRLWRT